ncbi:MAG TPA: hypothetical protein VK608_16280 [Edaphobacter sp.]|nr:hypothetical protein [Edaphobacter sp.]
MERFGRLWRIKTFGILRSAQDDDLKQTTARATATATATARTTATGKNKQQQEQTTARTNNSNGKNKQQQEQTTATARTNKGNDFFSSFSMRYSLLCTWQIYLTAGFAGFAMAAKLIPACRRLLANPPSYSLG